MKPKQPKAKFRVGQVVKHRIAGGFYMRILRYKGIVGDGPAWDVMEQGKITSYWHWQLRPLTAREIGPRRRAKARTCADR
jgi:hypothetical protein